MSIPALHLDHFDPETPATEDLFQHVNGRWLATAQIPPDRGSWGAFDALREASEHAVRGIIEGLDPDADLTTGVGKAAALYATFMAEQEIEERGVGVLAGLLERIDRIDSAESLAMHWGWSVRHGITSIVDLDNDADPGQPDRYRLFVSQSGIGLPDEEYYRLEQHAATREAYLAHIERSLRLARVEEPAQQAAAAFEVETLIAGQHWDKVRTRDMVEMYHPQQWADFVAQSSVLSWDAFLTGAELPESCVAVVINAQRSYCPGLAALMGRIDLASWRAWARWQLVNSLASFLTAELVEANFDFYGRTLNGIPQLKDRWKRGVALVEGALGEVIGQLYVEQHFPPATKAACQQLVDNLLLAYHRSIESLDWMSEPTRQEALTKLAAFRAKIGYPDKWRDYSALHIEPGDLVGNVLRVASFELDHTIEQLSGPVDRQEWFMFPQTVNAYYHPLRNEIVFPAAILQPPFFNVDADPAVNYGGIGAVIGHEIGHGFDDQGSTCDGEGRLRDWWTDQDRAAFAARTGALVAQYEGLSPRVAPDAHVNGELTLGENIGDLGGLSIAHAAWLIDLAGRGADPQEIIEGYTAEQRFFLSWAAIWQDVSRPEAMRERVATDPHSPDELRCNQVARNVPAFHRAFGTVPGQGMWLDPADRVRIW